MKKPMKAAMKKSPASKKMPMAAMPADNDADDAAGYKRGGKVKGKK